MHGQHHTPNNPFGDLASIWWRLLRAGKVVANRLRAAGGQTPSDLHRKKAFWIALCVWGVGAVTLWWLGRTYVTETTEALFTGVGFFVGFFYPFALGPILDFIERHIQHWSHG
jgi:hypothetical protein